jgi:pimeloyl-ACP methyl ester carboxylesterase
MKMKSVPVMMAIGMAYFAQSPAPTFEPPVPTGRSPIATTRWVVKDPSRPETFAPGKTREVEVVAWYPAVASIDKTAPYMRDGMEEALSFARRAKLGDTWQGLASVKTHAVLDGAPAASPDKFPVILFQHGFTGLPSSHTALMEDLASHGWAVLNIIHPYEAAGSMLSDGRLVLFTDEKDAVRQGITDVLNEWGPEDATMAKVTEAKDEAEKEKLMRGYLATLKNTDLVVKRWVADTRFVIDHLPKDGVAGRVAARLDLTRLGAAGHSMGGVSSAAFCLEDRRCKAALNLDGIPQYGSMIDAKMPAPFLMVYSGRPGRAGASDIIYSRSAAKYYRVDMAGTKHLDFTDMNFWGGPLRQRGAYGTIDPKRAAELTRLIVREYFAQEILGQPSSFLSGSTPVDGLTVAKIK